MQKLKAYIQTRIEAVDYHIQGIPNNSMNGFYHGCKESFKEVVEELDFLLGKDG